MEATLQSTITINVATLLTPGVTSLVITLIIVDHTVPSTPRIHFAQDFEFSPTGRPVFSITPQAGFINIIIRAGEQDCPYRHPLPPDCYIEIHTTITQASSHLRIDINQTPQQVREGPLLSQAIPLLDTPPPPYSVSAQDPPFPRGSTSSQETIFPQGRSFPLALSSPPAVPAGGRNRFARRNRPANAAPSSTPPPYPASAHSTQSSLTLPFRDASSSQGPTSFLLPAVPAESSDARSRDPANPEEDENSSLPSRHQH